MDQTPHLNLRVRVKFHNELRFVRPEVMVSPVWQLRATPDVTPACKSCRCQIVLQAKVDVEGEQWSSSWIIMIHLQSSWIIMNHRQILSTSCTSCLDVHLLVFPFHISSLHLPSPSSWIRRPESRCWWTNYQSVQWQLEVHLLKSSQHSARSLLSQELQSDAVHLEQLEHWDKAGKQVELWPFAFAFAFAAASASTTGLLCFGAILPKHTFKSTTWARKCFSSILTFSCPCSSPKVSNSKCYSRCNSRNLG